MRHRNQWRHSQRAARTVYPFPICTESGPELHLVANSTGQPRIARNQIAPLAQQSRGKFWLRVHISVTVDERAPAFDDALAVLLLNALPCDITLQLCPRSKTILACNAGLGVVQTQLLCC